MLKEYPQNSEAVNHAVVKMLYRIACQLKMAPLLYQISVFRTLQLIMDEPSTPRFKVRVSRGVVVVMGFKVRVSSGVQSAYV